MKAAEEQGGQEEKQRYLDAGDDEGVTALMRAVRSSTEDTVKVGGRGAEVARGCWDCVSALTWSQWGKGKGGGVVSDQAHWRQQQRQRQWQRQQQAAGLAPGTQPVAADPLGAC